MGQEITRFKLTAKHPILYRFTCEQCGRDNEWQTYTFENTEETVLNGWNVSLPMSTQMELNAKAKRGLEGKIAETKKSAEKGRYIFSDKCRYCKKWQSWGANGIWWSCLMIPMILGIPLTVFFWLISALKRPWAPYVILGVIAVSFTVTFIYSLARTISAAKVKNKQIPVIDWNGK